MSRINIIRIIVIQSSKNFIRNIHKCPNKRCEADVIDEFTTQLLQKKSNEWETKRSLRNIKFGKLNCTVEKKISNKKTGIYVDVSTCDEEDIDKILMHYVDVSDRATLLSILEQCCKYQIFPSFKMLDLVLKFCARNGMKDIILLVRESVKDIYREQLKSNSYFNHYLAETFWIRGNITESIRLFEEVYQENIYVRKNIRTILRYLITDTISERSEAVLVAVINLTEKLVQQYNDYFLLAFVWQVCFLSEWYADHCTANRLLEKHAKLPEAIVYRVPYILHTGLRDHQPEIIHRLLEILLKYDQKTECARVLQYLFNYRYRNNDFRSCAEIVQWSINLEVPLLTVQQEQFVSLLLGQQTKPKEEVSKIQSPDFQLKF